MSQPYWVIQREMKHGTATLCRNGGWFYCADPSNFKVYRTAGWMSRKLGELCERGVPDVTARAIHSTDCIDFCGRIRKADK